MRELIDFTNGTTDPLDGYRGNNGKKISLRFHDEWYMVKFPNPDKKLPEAYTSSIFSEDICCRIFNSVGIKAQETRLGTFTSNGKTRIVCACKDMCKGTPLKLVEFAQIKNAFIDSPRSGYGTDLNDVLQTIEHQTIFNASQLSEYFWNMFIIDAYIGNFDRHNGNWGFLVNDANQSAEISPVFDCGSSLYPQATDKQIEAFLGNEDEIKARVYVFPTSTLKMNGKKINYHDFLIDSGISACDSAIGRMLERIDDNEIKKIIYETPAVSDVRKEFYCKMLKERKSLILEAAYERIKPPCINLTSQPSIKRTAPKAISYKESNCPELEK